MIRRERRLLWTAFVVACIAHAALVAWMARVTVQPTGFSLAPRVQNAPLIVPITPPRPSVGEVSGKGESIASVNLPEPAQSPQPREIEQAFTRQQASPATPAPADTPRTSPPASDPLGPTAMLPPLAASPAQEASAPAERQAPNGLIPPKPSPSAEAATVATPPPPEVPQPAAQPPAAEAAASNSAPPAPKGESDLDAFARAEGVDFRAGKIEARTGRQVRLVRPRVDLAFRADATALSGRRVRILLQIETDAAGAPTKVEVVQSSGSRNIDDAVRLAMFSSFFGGKMPDSFPFGITLWQ